MDVLEKLKKKHEIKHETKDPSIRQPGDEIDSADMFLDYIKTCDGFSLYLDGGKPTLHFKPGIDLNNADRWDQACQASQLMLDAADGLKDRIRRRKLKLLPHPGYGHGLIR